MIHLGRPRLRSGCDIRRAMFEGVITALVTPFRRRSARRRCTAPSGRRADRRGHRRAGSGRDDGRIADADQRGTHPGHRDRRSRRPRSACRSSPARVELDARGDRAVRGGEARRRRRPAAGHAVLQPPRPGAHLPPLQGDHGGRVAADDPLQRAGRTASDLLPETIARLAEMPELVGVKEATGSALRASQVDRARRRSVAVLSGDDATAFPLFALGGRGVISVVSNVAPALMSGMWDAAAAGRLEQGARAPLPAAAARRGAVRRGQPDPGQGGAGDDGPNDRGIRPPLYPLAEHTAPSCAPSSTSWGCCEGYGTAHRVPQTLRR